MAGDKVAYCGLVCSEFEDIENCKKLNGFMAKVFGMIFKSDRLGNLDEIKLKGLNEFKESRKS